MVRLGSDLLLASSRLTGKRVGIVCNHASLDRAFLHIVDRLAAADNLTLAAIFGPQHGFRSDVQDNMIETPHVNDPGRRVPIYSLYSETREPTPEMLRGLDVLVIDLQDIGARIYTYIYTMANCMRACARHRIPVIVCDRPNPIGGADVEGARLLPGFESFVGQFPIPMRHGMTIGELARFFNDVFAIGAQLEVVPMEGWRRQMYADQTDLPWVMPSPNMPTLDTTGVYFRPAVFEPTFQKHAKQPCGGCQIHVTARQLFKPVLVGVALAGMFWRTNPSKFAWRQPPYEYEHDKMPIDILAGSDTLRKQIEADVPVTEIAAEWRADEEAFRNLREPFLLYS
jgi:uncharacterized protein YbbC (DUF1343 family)